MAMPNMPAVTPVSSTLETTSRTTAPFFGITNSPKEKNEVSVLDMPVKTVKVLVSNTRSLSEYATSLLQYSQFVLSIVLVAVKSYMLLS